MRLGLELYAFHRDFSTELQRAQEAVGLDEEILLSLERAQLPLLEERWGRREVEDVLPTAHLDDLVDSALARLRPLATRDWLLAEAERPYRLPVSAGLLHIVSGTRLQPAESVAGPHRFAAMLLVAQDHLARRDDLDFFEAAMAVPELAMLGHSLDAIQELGPQAVASLAALHAVDSTRAASLIHELLVGAAFVRRGRDVRMLPENRSTKVPDFELRGMGVPLAIECKRRLGITTYERTEARHVEELYTGARELLIERGVHASIEVVFVRRVVDVEPAEFRTDCERLLAEGELDGATVQTAWGALYCEVLPYTVEFPRTRLYSPEYLQRVFGWTQLQSDWDGLLCEVDAPPRVIVQSARNPRCLKWVSLSPAGLMKKARGVSSLWRDAAAQFRAAEMGLIYIAYPEGGRIAVADARTAEIQREVQRWEPTRWSVQIPMSVVGRLYPRSLGAGLPDLIESSFGATIDGDEEWLRMFPVNVFTLDARRLRDP